MTVTPRFDLRTTCPDGFAAMMRLHACVKASGLESALLEIVKLRVSQVNGCAFCVDLHATAARELGEREARLHLLAAWLDAPGFSTVERAALHWAEALTRLADRDGLDAAFDQAARALTLHQIAELTLAVAEVNAWNRLMIAARTPPMSMPRTPSDAA